ncbi:diguanylate cyclase domain-containing protein [Pseudothermotoga sp. U03pept]|uniref:GAF domain-containing protein n=1 Tax=Pseudothermotoga sp. U03pept TaxID=3447012 RepID=UPI003F046DE3
MFKNFLLVTIVLALAIVFASFLISRNFQQRFSLVKSIYQMKVEELAKAISLGYFQWDYMYSAVIENDIKEIEEQFHNIKKRFPQVKDVQLVEESSLDLPLYRIESHKTELLISFKIYDDSMTRFIEDKVALAVVDAQEILNTLEVKEIKIAEKGREFVYGLTVQRVKLTFVDLLIAMFCIVGAFFSFSGALLLKARTKIKVEQHLKKELEKQHRITQTLLEVTMEFLHRQAEDEYDYWLKKAIEIVPGSQGGSVLVKDNDRYIYVAAVGFDLKELRKISFSSQEISDWIAKSFSVRTKLKEYDEARIPREKLEILKKAARIDEIKSTLIVPVKLKNEVVLLLNLDNFESEEAFTEESVELAKIFANHLGIVLQRKNLEKTILEQRELMEYLSYHDALTGLANRRMFEEYSQKIISLAQREGKKVTVLFMDLKHFKQINDIHGHQVGDEVLRIIGSRLEKSLRESDLISRFGGDEFVIILYDCSSEDLNRLLERIIRVVEEPVEIAGEIFRISCNIGVARYPDDGTEIDQLIRKADMAMYRAKSKSLKALQFEDIQECELQ